LEKLYLACDHAAFAAKEFIKEKLNHKFEIVDLGTHSLESTHYPIYGKKLAEAVLASNNGKGIALCGSGIGISIAVNRFKGIRGALCRSLEDAKMSRLHNNSNILCLGARNNTESELLQIIETWLMTPFEGGRHQERIEILDS
jgi:ribose 5-phosphate isomerase B